MGQEIILPSKRLVSADGGAMSKSGGTRLIACPKPLSDERIDVDLPEGLTILEMMELSGIDPRFWKFSHAWLSDPSDWTKDPVFVPHDYWHVVRPKPGITVTLRAAPGKSGGSKGALGIVLRIVVTVIAAVATWWIGGLGGALVGTAIAVAGSLAVNALIPPPKGPQPPVTDNSRIDSKAYSITGARNQANPYGVVPRIFGRFRYTPPYGANPYTELVGNDQYIRLLFVFGYGPLLLEEPKIGETPLSNYQDVELVIRQGFPDDGPLTLFSNNIQEEQFSVEILNDFVHSKAVIATGQLTLTDNFFAGDQVRIGSKTYTIVSDLGTVANQVQLAPTAAETLANLISAITRAAGAGTLYSAATIAHSQVTASGLGSGMKVTALVAGAAANAIVTTTTSVNASWGSGTLTGGVNQDAVIVRDIPAVGILDIFGNLQDAFPGDDHGNGARIADTVRIGQVLFTAGTGGDHANLTFFPVGATAAQTAKNLADHINLYQPTPVEAALGAGIITVTADVAGAGGNSIAVSTNNTRAVWRTPTLRGGISGYQQNPMLEEEGWISRTSKEDADEVSLDINFPQGLVQYTATGQKAPLTVRFDIRYRKAKSDDDWIYLSTQSHATLTLNTNVTDGAQVQIGIDTYTFQAALTNQARNVQIGASAAESLQNLVAAINRSDGAGTRYASATVRHVVVSAEADGNAMQVNARRVGSATGSDGDKIPVWVLNVDGGWDSPFLFGGDDALPVTAKDTAVRTGKRIVLPSTGQYEVQLRRLTKNGTTTDVFDRSYWTVLRTIRYGKPINMTGIATAEMRIRATDQLNGIIDQFNMIATSILPAWDGTAWTSQPTRNPAACYLDVLRGKANKKPRSDDQIYWPDFVAWAEACDALAQDGQPKFCCDGVVDYLTTVDQILGDIASSGRATRGLRDGKHTIVRDIPQTVPVQHFTPRNSRGTKWTKQIIEVPHGLRVRFPNEEKGWQIDERIVYTDGYDKANATVFQTFNLPLTTRTNQIWRDTRYHMGQARLRPVIYQTSVDPEYLACRRGDLIASAHDVLLHGLGSGRIKRVTVDEETGQGTALLLDERMPMVAGKTYGLRVRYSTGLQRVIPVQTDPGEKNLLTPLLPIAAADLPERGDLVSFGETGREAIMLIVNSIKPDNDLGATLTFLDAAPAIHDLDTGDIPPYDPQITLPPVVRRQPPKPVIANVQSDEAVLALQPDGSLVAQIVITLAGLSGGDLPAATVETQYRRSNSIGAWSRLPAVPAGQGVVTIVGVDDGETYDLRLRSVAAVGVASDWAAVMEYEVIGKTTPPPDAVLRVENGVARWTFPFIPRDFRGTLIRQRPGIDAIWEQGTSLLPAPGVVPVNEFALPRFTAELTTVMVKGIDTAGNESVNCASIVMSSDDALAINLLHVEDHAALGFPGEIAGGAVVDDLLVANTNGGIFWGPPGSAFWNPDPTAPFWGGGFQELTYTTSVLPRPDDPVCILEIETAIAGDSWSIEYRKPNAVPFWASTPGAPFWADDPLAPFWKGDAGEWWPWPGYLTVGERRSIDIRITVLAGSRPGVISKLNFVFGAEDQEEFINDFAVPAEGAVLPTQKTWRRIKNIQLTPVADGGNAVTVKTLDKQALLVAALDANQAQTAGMVDARIYGVKGN